MLKVIIDKNSPSGKSVVSAAGSVIEIATDVAVVINAIHTQFKSQSLETAREFRIALTNLVNDPNSNLWKPQDGQTGIAIHVPEEE